MTLRFLITRDNKHPFFVSVETKPSLNSRGNTLCKAKTDKYLYLLAKTFYRVRQILYRACAVL